LKANSSGAGVVLGLRANWRQFALLVAITAFVGGMIGLERSILPLLAREEFGVTSSAAAVSFISTFGLAKALTNLLAGHIAAGVSRKRLLVLGWLFGIPVPLILIWAPSWGWIVGANLLLGVNQGLTWSMTVNMKVDLVGPRQRGLALGFNEAAGYMAVAAAAFLTGVIAGEYGLRPEPFYLGIGLAAGGLGFSVALVRDTSGFVALESVRHTEVPRASLARTFAETTWRRRELWGASQAGFVNNLNDGVIWGLFPLFFAGQGLGIQRIAVLAAAYPLIWGSLQLVTGWLSDSLGRKPLIVGGMLIQGVAILLSTVVDSFEAWLLLVVLVGAGTAMVYPSLLAAISDAVHPEQRSASLGVYRFWRDAGAIVGALIGGALADAFSFSVAIQLVAGMTILSGVVAARALDAPFSKGLRPREAMA
jgi:MFS family permease